MSFVPLTTSVSDQKHMLIIPELSTSGWNWSLPVVLHARPFPQDTFLHSVEAGLPFRHKMAPYKYTHQQDWPCLFTSPISLQSSSHLLDMLQTRSVFATWHCHWQSLCWRKILYFKLICDFVFSWFHSYSGFTHCWTRLQPSCVPNPVALTPWSSNCSRDIHCSVPL